MSRQFKLRVLVTCLCCSGVLVANADPIFFVSTSPDSDSPGMLDLFGNVPPGTTGTLYIWAFSDVRLSGVSLDLLELGGGIKFTGLNVYNPDNRWAFLDGPQSVSDSAVVSIGGAAIPGVIGNGIGPESPQGAHALLAAVEYMPTGSQSTQLALRVGRNIIADWFGNTPTVRFGTGSSPPIDGGVPGGTGPVGQVLLGVVPGSLTVLDANLEGQTVGQFINHTFQITSNYSPIIWNNLSVAGPGGAVPALPPMLGSDGTFTWASADSAPGIWTFQATANNLSASEVGTLTIELVVPEPTTAGFVAVAFAGMAMPLRRRCKP